MPAGRNRNTDSAVYPPSMPTPAMFRVLESMTLAGAPHREIGAKVGVAGATVGAWQRRYALPARTAVQGAAAARWQRFDVRIAANRRIFPEARA